MRSLEGVARTAPSLPSGACQLALDGAPVQLELVWWDVGR